MQFTSDQFTAIRHYFRHVEQRQNNTSHTSNRCSVWNNGLSSLQGELMHCTCNRMHVMNNCRVSPYSFKLLCGLLKTFNYDMLTDIQVTVSQSNSWYNKHYLDGIPLLLSNSRCANPILTATKIK